MAFLTIRIRMLHAQHRSIRKVEVQAWAVVADVRRFRGLFLLALNTTL